MTDYNDKIRAVVLAALMVFSVFAGTVALSGTAVADTTNFTSQTAENVEIGQSSVTQNVTVDVTTDGSTETITLDPTASTNLVASNVTNAQVVSTTDALTSGTTSLSSGGVFSVDVSGNTSTSKPDGTLTVRFTYDTSGISSTSSGVEQVTIDDSGSGTDASPVSPSFSLVDTIDPTANINSATPDPVGPGGTVTVDYDLQDSGTGVNTGASDVVLTDANGDSLTNGSVSAGTGNTVTFDLTNLPGGSAGDGSISITLNAEDSAGNTNTASTTIGTNYPTRAANRNGRGTFDTSNGEGAFFPGATVYQGESDVFQSSAFASTPTKAAGDAEGVPLDFPDIPQSQATGRYTDGSGSSVTVQTPRVNTPDIRNTNGEDIAGGTVYEGTDTSGAGNLTVVGAWNYQNAENLELTVTDDSGLDVTADVLEAGITGNDAVRTNSDVGPSSGVSGSTSSARLGGYSVGPNEVVYPIDLSNSGTGTYTVELAGTDDLDFGEASQNTTITVSGDDDATLTLNTEDVTRGEDVTFEISGSDAGDTHTVLIQADELRESFSLDQASKVFRLAGDTDEVGIGNSGSFDERANVPTNITSTGNVGYVYAEVTIDDDTGIGVGQIETQYLDDTDVDVTLYDQNSAAPGFTGVPFNPGSSTAEDNESDEQTLSVEEGNISIESPDNTYVVGSEVLLNGTASEGIDEIAFFVRRQAGYQLMTIDGDAAVNVDADNTFEKEDVILSQGSLAGNDELSQPGTYRFGALDTEGLSGSDQTAVQNNNDLTLSTSEFSTNTSTQKSLRVVDTELSATFQTIGGQIALEDNEINVSGTALGSQSVTILFVDERGNTVTESISVDDQNTFDEDELSLANVNGGNLNSLAEGTVSAHALITGRDDQFGDGNFDDVSGTSYSQLDNFVDALGQADLTGQQVRSRIVDETTDEVASDDRMVTSQFRIAEAQTTIGSVYPEGAEASGVNPVAVNDTLVAEGSTNLQPEDNSITLELLTQGGDSVALTTTEQWSLDGSY